MLVDCCMVYGLHVWEKRLKAEKARIAGEQAVVHETEKRDARAVKAANRQQRKASERKNKNQGQPYVTTKHNIMQPDKSKKT